MPNNKLVSWLLAVTLVLSALSSAFFALIVLISGAAASGSNNTGGDGAEVLFLASIAVLGVATATMLWRRLRKVDFSVYFHRAPRQPVPPAYPWTCHVCGAPNVPGQARCEVCGSSPNMPAVQIDAARRRWAEGGQRPTAAP